MAFYLKAKEDAPILERSAVYSDLSTIALRSPPVIADGDFTSINITNGSFSLKAEAVKRLSVELFKKYHAEPWRGAGTNLGYELAWPDIECILCVSNTRVCSCVFSSPVSSQSYEVTLEAEAIWLPAESTNSITFGIFFSSPEVWVQPNSPSNSGNEVAHVSAKDPPGLFNPWSSAGLNWGSAKVQDQERVFRMFKYGVKDSIDASRSLLKNQHIDVPR